MSVSVGHCPRTTVHIASHDNHQMLAIPHTVIRRFVMELSNSSAR